MNENKIPGMDDFGKKLAAEIDARKAAACKRDFYLGEVNQSLLSK